MLKKVWYCISSMHTSLPWSQSLHTDFFLYGVWLSHVGWWFNLHYTFGQLEQNAFCLIKRPLQLNTHKLTLSATRLYHSPSSIAISVETTLHSSFNICFFPSREHATLSKLLSFTPLQSISLVQDSANTILYYTIIQFPPPNYNFCSFKHSMSLLYCYIIVLYI